MAAAWFPGHSLTSYPEGGAVGCCLCRQSSALPLVALLIALLCSEDEKSETKFRIYYFSTAFHHSLIWDIFITVEEILKKGYFFSDISKKILNLRILLYHEKYTISQDESSNTVKNVIFQP